MATQNDEADQLGDLSTMWADADDAPPPRRRRRWIGWIVALIVLVVLFGTPTAYVVWALNAPVSAPTVTSAAPAVTVPAAAAIALPADGATAIAISGADEYLGAEASGTWATSGGNDTRPIASISKLITALVILDARPLAGPEDPGPTIRFSEADADLYDAYYVQGATIAAMPAGSSMSQYDALATMLIPSASNYADAVSSWAFGSRSAFLTATRQWLAEHGLTGTTIVEPTGISPRNVSTPSDLIAIAKLAAADPVVARITSTPSLTLPEVGTLPNTNNLLGTAGIDGLKTGNLGANNFNLLYTATVDVGAAAPIRVTGVRLGGVSRESAAADVVALLTSIDNGFHDVPLATAGQEVGSFSTAWGSSARMVLKESAAIFTWSDTPIIVTMETSTPVTYEDGEVIGSVTWTAGPNTATSPVVIEGDIEPPTESWRLTHPQELGAG